MDDQLEWWLKALAYAAFSTVGGVMGHLMRSIARKEQITWSRCAVEGIAAGFVGLLMLLLCQAMEFSPQWTGVIVGVSGWLGASATIQLLEGVVRKRLGIEGQANVDNGSPPSTPVG